MGGTENEEDVSGGDGAGAPPLHAPIDNGAASPPLVHDNVLSAVYDIAPPPLPPANDGALPPRTSLLDIMPPLTTSVDNTAPPPATTSINTNAPPVPPLITAPPPADVPPPATRIDDTMPPPATTSINTTALPVPPLINNDARFVPPAFVNETWLRLPLQEISACSLGPQFSRTLELLCELECGYGFKNKTRGFSVKGRPAQLDAWVRAGRGSKKAKTPHVSNALAFADVWWTWWLTLQPGWRGSSRPLSKGAYEGSWEPLVMPGANAMLGPVACLYWWGRTANGVASEQLVVDGGSIETWQDAVEDINYVLEGLIMYNAEE